ncbi:MAG: caspase family protein [Synechococcus sp.]|nr:caspase family protein [Synechococcus sp.]
MAWRRRDFLQTLGLVCGTLGFSASLPPAVMWQTAQALSGIQGRKWALLMGVNRYGPGFDLEGVQQDVKIQKNLLAHRFGFAANNILSLQGDEAIFENFQQSLQVDLKARVQPDDLLFVHFSGYGVRLMAETGPVPALVFPSANGPQAIALSTIQRWLEGLNPAQTVFVLDTSFDSAQHPPASYWYPRTYPDPQGVMAVENVTEMPPPSRSNRGRSPLIQLLAAAQGVTPEVQVNGVMTGLFTAALGRYLTTLNPLTTVTTAQGALPRQLPQDETQPAQVQCLGPQTAPLYGVVPSESLPGSGNIFNKTASSLDLYLGGFSPELSQAIALGSEFTTQTTPPITLQLASKAGVFGQGKTTTPTLPPGTVIQETKRYLPRNLTLKIALAEQLGRIERVDATSAFAALASVASVSNPQDWVDYIFDGQAQLLAVSGQVIPGVMPASDANEAIKSSVTRLQPRLEQLLALKWLRLLGNETSTQFPLKITEQRLDRFSTVLAETVTPLDLGQTKTKRMGNPQPTFTLAEKGFYTLENTGPQRLCCLGFAQSPKQELFLLTPKEGISLGALEDTTVEFTASRPLGIWTTYWIVGDRPFENFQDHATQLFGDLETIPQKLEKPLPLIQALLSDLEETPPEGSEPNKENYIFSTAHWAGVCFSHTVTESTPL